MPCRYDKAGVMSDTAKPGRCLGLIGGLGPGATVHYYRELIAGHERQGRVPRLLIAHADIQRVYALVIAKDFEGLASYLAGLIGNMAAGGAELTAIVAVTPHICASQLEAISSLPLINMLTEVRAAVNARGLKRVPLLGTRFTIETQMFGSLDAIETYHARGAGTRADPGHLQGLRRGARLAGTGGRAARIYPHIRNARWC